MSMMRPNIKALPGIPDTNISRLKLQDAYLKALPPVANIGSGTSAKEIEARELLRDMGIAFAYTKAMQARNKAIARLKNKRSEKIARNFGLRRR